MIDPNPSDGNINLSLGSLNPTDRTYSVFEMLGALVEHCAIPDHITIFNISMKLNSGQYLIVVSDGLNAVSTLISIEK